MQAMQSTKVGNHVQVQESGTQSKSFPLYSLSSAIGPHLLPAVVVMIVGLSFGAMLLLEQDIWVVTNIKTTGIYLFGSAINAICNGLLRHLLNLSKGLLHLADLHTSQ